MAARLRRYGHAPGRRQRRHATGHPGLHLSLPHRAGPGHGPARTRPDGDDGDGDGPADGRTPHDEHAPDGGHPSGDDHLPARGRPRVTATAQATVAPTPPPDPQEAGAPKTQLFANGRLQPEKVRVSRSASGRYRVVPGESLPPRGKKKVVRYKVEVERGLPFDAEEFAREVHRILNDPRGWGFRFHRVSRGPVDIRVSLSSPAMTDRRCLPLRTFGLLSCWNGGRAVINAMRWNEGVPGYRGDVASYREYVVSHEVGHGLGHGHVPVPARAARPGHAPADQVPVRLPPQPLALPQARAARPGLRTRGRAGQVSPRTLPRIRCATTTAARKAPLTTCWKEEVSPGI
nr:hypothetical protein GCM10020093_024500 [Planobispora longispora]